MAEENLVPDDELKSATPDAIVTLEDPKVEPEKPKVTVTELPKESPKDAAAEGVEELAKNLEAAKKKAAEAETTAASERAARIAAEEGKKAAEGRISNEVQQNITSNRIAAQNAIEAAKAKRDQAKKDFIALQAEGKFDEAFEATQLAAEATNTIRGAEGYLAQLETYEEEQKKKPSVTEKIQVDDGNVVDPVTKIRMSPTAFNWVSEHKEQWKDQDFRAEVDAAVRKALRDKIERDSPEYFEFIEKRLQREGYLEMPTETEETPKPVVKKPSAASMGAAPTRAVPGTKSVPAKGVKLSGIEREIAKSFKDSLPDVYSKDDNADQIWARNKLAIQQEAENE